MAPDFQAVHVVSLGAASGISTEFTVFVVALELTDSSKQRLWAVAFYYHATALRLFGQSTGLRNNYGFPRSLGLQRRQPEGVETAWYGNLIAARQERFRVVVTAEIAYVFAVACRFLHCLAELSITRNQKVDTSVIVVANSSQQEVSL